MWPFDLFVREEIILINIKAFKKWLQKRYAVLQEPRSDDEVLRFATTKGDGVVHRTNEGRMLPNAIAAKAIRAFTAHNSWSSGFSPFPQQGKRLVRKADNRRRLVRAIAERDGGMRCGYCGRELTVEESTLEHVLPLSKGGVDSMDNLILSCRRCNLLCGDYPIAKKLQLMRTIMEKYGAPVEELSEEKTIGYADIAGSADVADSSGEKKKEAVQEGSEKNQE
mgnify:CR=1 FL=1